MVRATRSLLLAALVVSLVFGCRHLKAPFNTGLNSRLTALPQCNGVNSHQAIVEYELFGGSADTKVDIELRSPGGDELTLPLAQRGPRGRIAVPIDERAGGELELNVYAFDPVNGNRKHSTCSAKLVACRRARSATETLVVAAILPLSGADQMLGRCLEQQLRRAAAETGRTDVIVIDSDLSKIQTGFGKLSRHRDIDAVVVYATPGTISRQAIELLTARGLPVFAIGSAPGGGATEIRLQQQDGCHTAAYQAITVAALANRGSTEITPSGDDFGIVLPPSPRDTCKLKGMLGDVEMLRPAVTSVEPATLPLGSTATVTVHGKFEASDVGIKLSKERKTIQMGHLRVERDSSSELVRFPMPISASGGRYTVVAWHGLNCESTQDVHLSVERQKNTEWFVMTLDQVLAEDDHDDNAHGEARFVLGGQSKTAPAGRRTNVTFPAGPYIAIKDPSMFVVNPDYLDDAEKPRPMSSTLEIDVPFVWEPVGQLGSEIGYSIGTLEDDKGSSGPEWTKPLLIALGTAIGCYVGENVEGCATGFKISEQLAAALDSWIKTEGNTYRYPTVGDTCEKDSFFCLGGPSNTIEEKRYNLNDGEKKLVLDLIVRRVDGPRLKEIRIDLRRVNIRFGHPGSGRDDWSVRPHGEEIYLIYRITPLTQSTRTLNAYRTLPDEAPGAKVFRLCSPEEQSDGCEQPSEITFNPGEARLYPVGYQGGAALDEATGIPAVHVEIGIWEDDGGDQQRHLGTHSRVFWMDDVIGDTVEFNKRQVATVHSFVDLTESSWLAQAIAAHVTTVDLEYDVYFRRAEP